MEAPTAETVYMFAHALLQRACYELMLPSARGELHRRALDYLSTHKLASPEELAAHALGGLAGAPPAIAAELKRMRRTWLDEASQAAIEHYANERGMALLAELLACEGITEADCVRLMQRRADLLNRMGRMNEAIEEAEAALKLAHGLDDAVETARAEFVLGRCCLDTSQTSRAQGLISSAVDRLRQTNDVSALEQAVSALARAQFTAGRPQDALPLAQEAVALAMQAGNEVRTIRCKMLLLNVLAQVSRNDEALALAAELTPVLETSNNPEVRCTLASVLASLSHGLDRLEESRMFHKRASREAESAGLQAELARAEVNLGGIALQLRRYTEGLAHVEQAEAMARELGNVRVLWFALRNRHEIYYAVGDYRAALEAATSATRLAESASMAWHFLLASALAAAAFLELGQADDALEWVERALSAPRTGQYLNFVLAKLHAQRACALFRLERQAEAGTSLEQMESFLKLAGSEPGEDSQRWIQEARARAGN